MDCMSETKCCYVCKKELPNTPEYFYRGRLNNDGLRYDCKKCVDNQNKKYYKKNHDKISRAQKAIHDRNKSINKDKIFDDSKMMECIVCHKELPMTPEHFYKNITQKYGLRQPCRECFYEGTLRGHALSLYDISYDEYKEIYNNQNGKCAICGKEESRTRKGRKLPLSVDHAHDTGVIRGLLCAKCNSGMGMFGDNIELMKKAIDYLKNNGDV